MTFEYTCTQCGTAFIKAQRVKSAHPFCSKACYDVWRTPSPIPCETCGQPLKGAQRTQQRRFCSRECYEASRPSVSKVCPRCGRTFTVPASMADRYTVCSRECRLATTEYIACERCGKVFTGEAGRVRRFCSEECRRPPVLVPCETCGTEFRRLPGDADRRFCSFACYRRFTGETLLEKRVRQELDALAIEFIQEARIGRYSADFMLPEHRVILEVDGDYWHRDKRRDARKNRYLAGYGWRVIRLPESEIDSAPCLSTMIAERIRAASGVEVATVQPALFDSH